MWADLAVNHICSLTITIYILTASYLYCKAPRYKRYCSICTLQWCRQTKFCTCFSYAQNRKLHLSLYCRNLIEIKGTQIVSWNLPNISSKWIRLLILSRELIGSSLQTLQDCLTSLTLVGEPPACRIYSYQLSTLKWIFSYQWGDHSLLWMWIRQVSSPRWLYCSLQLIDCPRLLFFPPQLKFPCEHLQDVCFSDASIKDSALREWVVGRGLTYTMSALLRLLH